MPTARWRGSFSSGTQISLADRSHSEWRIERRVDRVAPSRDAKYSGAAANWIGIRVARVAR
jgi:hypothetical protein